AAWAEDHGVDNNAEYGGNNYPPSGYGTSGAYVGGEAEAPTSAHGMVFTLLQQMQQQIAQMRGMLEEQQNENPRLQEDGLERYHDLDRRLSSGAAGAAATQNAPAAGAASAGPAAAAGQAQAPASNGPADPEKEKLFYDAAFDLIKAKDFAKASQAFSAFV